MPTFYEAATEAQGWMEQGHCIHQRFNCVHCGVRQTMAEPNMFFQKGQCEACGGETDLVVHGCNYLIVTRASPAH